MIRVLGKFNRIKGHGSTKIIHMGNGQSNQQNMQLYIRLYKIGILYRFQNYQQAF